MAKSITQFEIIARGDGLAPAKLFIQYVVTDGDLSKQVSHEVVEPSFNNVIHASGQIGELWRDLVDGAKTEEGIS